MFIYVFDIFSALEPAGNSTKSLRNPRARRSRQLTVRTLYSIHSNTNCMQYKYIFYVFIEL